MIIKRGDIFMADLSPVKGCEQGGVRPVLVVQNDVGNKYSPTVIVVAITSKLHKAKIPTHVEINSSTNLLPLNSIILAEQIRTIDKNRLSSYICTLPKEKMREVEQALIISIGLF